MAGYGLDSADHLNLYLEKDLQSLNIQSSITNASVSGDTTSGGLNRLNWSLQGDYDLFVLGLGANDMLRGIAPEITKTNLSKIIDTVLDKDIKFGTFFERYFLEYKFLISFKINYGY